jgi:hypothetical protein
MGRAVVLTLVSAPFFFSVLEITEGCRHFFVVIYLPHQKNVVLKLKPVSQ